MRADGVSSSLIQFSVAIYTIPIVRKLTNNLPIAPSTKKIQYTHHLSKTECTKIPTQAKTQHNATIASFMRPRSRLRIRIHSELFLISVLKCERPANTADPTEKQHENLRLF